MQVLTQIAKQYLVASDFDQTLSFHDSGAVLSERQRSSRRKILCNKAEN